MENVTIIGSGSWGIALGVYLANLGHNITMWSFAQDENDEINNQRICRYLPGITIPDNLKCTTSFEEALKDSKLVLHVTPSKFVRNTVKGYKDFVKEDQMIVMCSKGFEPETDKTLEEVVLEEVPNAKFGVLSGPSHAEEVSKNVPTALVIASEHEDIKKYVANVFKSENMRIYSSSDVKGVQIGGALKNIIALCSGIAQGLGLGDNTYAALATRGLVEIERLGTAMGAQSKTFYGLTGLGDLLVTCGSKHSRNRRAGEMLGQGHTLEEARKEIGMVIESVDNIDVAYSLSKKYNVEMPIVESVYKVLYNGNSPKEELVRLMTRNLKAE